MYNLGMSTRFKIDLALLAVTSLAIAGIVVARRQSADFRIPFSEVQIHRTGKNGKEMPANTDVGFTFVVENPVIFQTHHYGRTERFRLLGAKMPSENERQEKGIDFAKEWLTIASKNVAWFVNWSNALQDDDGTWIVWVEALRDSKLRNLNADIVQPGFPSVHYLWYPT